MIRLVAIVLLICIWNKAVRGYSFGAPERSCVNMKPDHARAFQTSDPPFEITHDVQNGYITPGANVKVELKSVGDDEFFGFLLQVRGAENEALGEFDYPSDDKIRRGCNRKAVTHVKGSDAPKTSISATWTAPDTPLEGISFVASIVKDYYTIWTDVKSSSFIVSNTPPPTTPATASPEEGSSEKSNDTCSDDNLVSLPDTWPVLAMLCVNKTHCPCGWLCCPMCDNATCVDHSICRQSLSEEADQQQMTTTTTTTTTTEPTTTRRRWYYRRTTRRPSWRSYYNRG